MNFVARLIHRRRRRRGCKKPATAKPPCLPSDVLASIFVRLPGSDLRRLRRVCKEWRDIIADNKFIQAHIEHGPRSPLTHTIVFYPGFTYGGRGNPRNGRGFLFDEHWRLTAELIAGVQDDFVGACNGLLCFLVTGQGSIKVVEPFTGESLALPLPPRPRWLKWTVDINPLPYCFGYDATTKRYKIVYYDCVRYNNCQELCVYTIGGGEGWRRLHVDRAVHGRAYGDPVYNQGSVYWLTRGLELPRRDKKLARFDLATENITSEAAKHLRLQYFLDRRWAVMFCRPANSTSCEMTYGGRGDWDAWFPGAEETEGLPEGHLLLHEGLDPGLYLRTMERSLNFGRRKLLLKVGKEKPRGSDHRYDGPTMFVRRRQHQLPIAGAPRKEQCYARIFGYAPTVSAAPLALYLGTPSP